MRLFAEGGASRQTPVQAVLNGAAAGLAGVFVKHKADAGLPRGTTVEMVTDRELRYQRSELR